MFDIRGMLAADAAAQQSDGDGYYGLTPVDDLRSREWDFSAPTLTAPGRRTGNAPAYLNSRTLARKFFERFPLFRAVTFDGILVAGRAIARYIRSYDWGTTDEVDVFIYAADPEQRLQSFIKEIEADVHKICRSQILDALRTLRDELQNPQQVSYVEIFIQVAKTGDKAYRARREGVYLSKPAEVNEKYWESALRFVEARTQVYYKLPEIVAIRDPESVTIYANDFNVRVHTRRYKNVSNILHSSFDVGVLASGYDGRNVWVTDLGKFAHETGCLVVDPARHGDTYRSRLEECFAQGFDLVFPHLDVGSLATRNLAYGYPEVADLPYLPFSYTSVAGNIIVFKEFLTKTPTEPAVAGPDPAEVADKNLYQLVTGGSAYVYAERGYGYACALRVMTGRPYLSLETLRSMYDRLRGACWDGERLNLRILERYIHVITLTEIVSRVYHRKETMNAVLDEIFLAQRHEAERLWREKIKGAETPPIAWDGVSRKAGASVEEWYKHYRTV